MARLAAHLAAAAALALAGTALAADAPALPPAEAGAKAALEASPRHHEWADLALPGGGKLSAFVAFPERADKAPVVVVIHEIYGPTDWIRSVADSLAAAGFLAVAPDLLTGRGPGGGDTSSFASRDDVVKAVRAIGPEEAAAALDAAARHAASLPAASGRYGAVGFCWGGARSFAWATTQPELGAAVVYYGTSPEADALAAVRAPVLGLYGGDDARVNGTVPPAEARMKELGKRYETHTYAGAGHGFLRQQDGRDGANLAAAGEAWPATVGFLRETLETPAP